MRSLSIAVAAAALVSAAAVSASAQGYPPGPPVYAAPSWMQDDGSSSDHPTHMPSDFSGDALNHAYRHGLTVPSDAPPGYGPPPE
jgi:opacity protein-like surface antigen